MAGGRMKAKRAVANLPNAALKFAAFNQFPRMQSQRHVRRFANVLNLAQWESTITIPMS